MSFSICNLLKKGLKIIDIVYYQFCATFKPGGSAIFIENAADWSPTITHDQPDSCQSF
jgi:hypothetical protein